MVGKNKKFRRERPIDEEELTDDGPQGRAESSHRSRIENLKSTVSEQSEIIAEYERRLRDQEVESLKRENTLLKQMSSTRILDNSPTQAVSFQDVQSVLPSFTGQDTHPIQTWIEEFESVANVLNLSDLQKFVFARRLMGGTARAALRATSNIKSWDDLKAHLIREFSQVLSSADVHRAMMKRKKRSEESYLDYFFYFFALMTIGKQANMEDKAIIDYAIRGINDSEFNKAILYSSNSLVEFKEKLRIYEKIGENSRIVQRRHGQVQTPTEKSRSASSDILCYNCGLKGHRPRECNKIKQGPKCFACHQFGHKSTECPQKVNAAKEISFVQEICDKDKPFSKLIKINGEDSVAYFDTGSDLSFVNENCYMRLGRPNLSMSTTFRGVGSKLIKTVGSFEAKLEIDGHFFEETFHVAPNRILPKECLVGKTLLGVVEITVKPDELVIKPLHNSNQLSCLHVGSEDVDLTHVADKGIAEELKKIITGYTLIKSKQAPVEMKLILKDETPIWQNPRRLAIAEQNVVNAQLDEWLREGIIQESDSDFASPIVLANKKDGSKRICIDFRALNNCEGSLSTSIDRRPDRQIARCSYIFGVRSP